MKITCNDTIKKEYEIIGCFIRGLYTYYVSKADDKGKSCIFLNYNNMPDIFFWGVRVLYKNTKGYYVNYRNERRYLRGVINA